MFSRIYSAGLLGIRGYIADVEADSQNGIPSFYLSGGLSRETSESRYRVWNGIRNSGVQIKPKKITVNISPASFRKTGTAFDLPIALAVMGALDLYDPSRLGGTLVIGELSLDGSVREVPGILPIVLAARESGCHTCILPKGNAAEGALAKGVRILGVDSLKEAAALIKGAKRYYLQQFKDSGMLIAPEGLSAFDKEEMYMFAEAVRPLIPAVSVRGVD